MSTSLPLPLKEPLVPHTTHDFLSTAWQCRYFGSWNSYYLLDPEKPKAGSALGSVRNLVKQASEHPFLIVLGLYWNPPGLPLACVLVMFWDRR